MKMRQAGNSFARRGELKEAERTYTEVNKYSKLGTDITFSHLVNLVVLVL